MTTTAAALVVPLRSLNRISSKLSDDGGSNANRFGRRRKRSAIFLLPTALLAQAEKAAQRQHISLDELVSHAVEQRVNRQEFEEVLAFGKGHARKRGLKPGDVAPAIAAVRAGQ